MVSTLSTIERALAVLEYLAAGHGEAGVSEIAASLHLNKTTAHQLLTSLRCRGVVEQNPVSRQYRLGPGVLRFGMAYLERLQLAERVQPALQRVRDAYGETVILNMRADDRFVSVAQAEGLHAVRRVVQIGSSQPIHCGAPGKAVMAFLSAAELQELLARTGLPALTPQTITDLTALLRELESVRAQGYATSFGEVITGVHAIAAPVFDYSRRPVGAVTVSGPGSRFDHESMMRHVPALLATAGEISRVFGAPRG